MSAPRFDVIVCGSLHLDIVVRAPRLPQPDETVTGTAWRRQCGGKGGNQAVGAARAGARTAMIGRVGADEFGDVLRANLRDAGVEARAVLTDAARGSGMSAAIIRDDGDYGAVIVSGANLGIPAETLGAVWRELGGARALVLQNEVPEAVNRAAAAAARDGGAVVVLNAAPARAVTGAAFDWVDVLVVNRVEAAAYSGRAVADRDGTREALADLARRAPNVVVTLGGDGVLIQSGGDAPLWIAPHPVRVVSTHGAGDCFVGTLAAGLARGEALADAARAANAAAAALVAGRPIAPGATMR